MAHPAIFIFVPIQELSLSPSETASLPPLNNLLSDVQSLGVTLARGPQGAKGAPGNDGKDGKDSVVPGPPGPCGPQGPRGDVTIVGDAELQAAVEKLRAEKARVQAALLHEIANTKHLSPGARAHVRLVLERIKSAF